MQAATENDVAVEQKAVMFGAFLSTKEIGSGRKRVGSSIIITGARELEIEFGITADSFRSLLRIL